MESAPLSNEMRLLVTGGAGFIGSNFVCHALTNGCCVLNIDCLSYAAGLRMLDSIASESSYEMVQADVSNEPLVEEKLSDFRPNAIVHFAAETHVDRSIANANAFVNSNVVGTFKLLTQVQKYFQKLPLDQQQSFRFLHVSTDEVYGSLGESGSFTESSPYDPHSPYSATKAASDHLVRAWHTTYKLPILIVHPSNNYGPNQHPEKLIPMVIRSCLNNLPIPIYGSGRNVRDWLYVQDFCDAIFLVLSRGQVGQSYNVGANNQWNNLELVNYLCDLVDEMRGNPKVSSSSRKLVQFVEDRPGHDFRYSMDCTKITTQCGWRPSHSWEDGLRKTIQWYLENPERLG